MSVPQRREDFEETIILTSAVVLVTLIVGSLLYVYVPKLTGEQTASNLPRFERTVPNIVPNTPSF